MSRVIMLDASSQDALANDHGYEMRVFEKSFDLAVSFEELEHLLDLLVRAQSFQEVTLLLKLYIIGWISLSDILANVLNEVFDLGYGEQDVEFGVLLRNRKVRGTAIPSIVRSNAKSIRYDHYVKLRNDIVHRGRLVDAELREVHSEVLSAVVLKTMHVDRNDATALANATREASAEVRTSERIRDLVELKRTQLREHLAATLDLLAQLCPVLVERVTAQPVVGTRRVDSGVIRTGT